MRIKVPLGLTKDQIFVTIFIGALSGSYIWNKSLHKHLKEQSEKIENCNEVIKQIISEQRDGDITSPPAGNPVYTLQPLRNPTLDALAFAKTLFMHITALNN